MSNSPTASQMENERQYQVVDQLLTMHSILRDKFNRRAFWLSTGLVTSSLFLTALSFMGDEIISALGFRPDMARLVLALFSVSVLSLSITEFRVNWRAAAAMHDEAAAKLSKLKATYRKVHVEGQGSDSGKNSKLTREFNRVMAAILPIPQAWFNPLKAEYKFNKALSQAVSVHPHSPIWYLRLRLRLEGFRYAKPESQGSGDAIK